MLCRKVTGLAGLPGPTVKQGNILGHAAATQKGSMELNAEETPTVKKAAKTIDDNSTNPIYLSFSLSSRQTHSTLISKRYP